MSAVQLSKIIKHVRSALDRQDAGGLSDGELLKRYCQVRDDGAFGVLVLRHGPMVMGVCGRILRNLHDAEDAFQATFLVLVRKAPSIRSPGMLGNWLYGTAYRTALEARRATLKRRAKEAKVVPKTEQVKDACTDLRDLLDHELERLPERYRAAIVLCELEGATEREAARSLRVPQGTVASRLARGKALLAKRLAQRGLALTSASLGGALSGNATANVSATLLSSTIHAGRLFASSQAAASGAVSPTVAALTEGVLRTMLISKLKGIFAIVFFVGSLATGANIITCCMAAGQNGNALAKEKQPAAAGEQQPDLGFYPPDKRLIERQRTDKSRAKVFAKLQAIASIEANLQKLQESTDEEPEREALDRIQKAVLWYKNTKWAVEQLSVENETVPFPTDKKQGRENEAQAAQTRSARNRPGSAPGTALLPAAPNPTGLQIPKVTVAPRIVRAVNVNQDRKWIILEELVIDMRDPAKPKEYTEWLQFDLHQGQVYWGDGSVIPDGILWKLLPKSTSESARTVLLSADKRALNPDFRSVLKPDTMILIGEVTLRGITEHPERQR
jgi:RNA polymerase sigma factor (sigma-70 family)